MSKKLLIACYFFPPCPSIGGRRSAKFAKYLAKMGDEIHVIQAVNPFPNTSAWLKDIQHEKNIHRHELPLNYPKEFIIPPSTLIGKIRYKLFNYFFDLFYSEKNRFDYTIFWEKIFMEKAAELIKAHDIKNILVSGPPFYYGYYSVKLKEKFPELNIIIDFRDPWIGSPYYGMSTLKAKQQEYEIKLLNEVYKKSDYFIGPNIFLLNTQKEFIYPGNQEGAKLVEVSHAYDKDEVSAFLNPEPLKKGEKIKLVYGGQLYPGTDPILKALSENLNQVKKNNSALYQNLQVDFYTPETDRAVIFSDHKEIVTFNKPVGNEIMGKIAGSTFCMIFLADHNKDFRTTKFLEYSILRRPFLIFGNKGYVAQFVEENKLGRAFDEQSIGDFAPFLNEFNKFTETGYNSSFDFSDYEFEKVTGKLRALLK